MGALEDRTAIVTGAGRGIGRATAIKLASEGARVVVNDLDQDTAATVAGEIADAGGVAVAHAGDITAAALGDELVARALDEYGSLDVLVSNAGYIWNSTLLKSTDEQLDAMLDVHVRGPVRLLRAAGNWFRSSAKSDTPPDHHRKVVNVSSLAGTHGLAAMASYATAKSAQLGLTKTLAKEWGRYRVNVNSVAFGHIETRLTQPYDGNGPPTVEVGDREVTMGLETRQVAAANAGTALGRPGTTDEAAGAIYLLCLPESDYVTGQVLMVSGGAAA